MFCIWREQPNDRIQSSNFLKKFPTAGSEELAKEFFTAYDYNSMLMDITLPLAATIQQVFDLQCLLLCNVISPDAFDCQLALIFSVKEPFNSLELTCRVYPPIVYNEAQAVVQKPKATVT